MQCHSTELGDIAADMRDDGVADAQARCFAQRNSSCGTERISPPRPSSPTAKVPGGSGRLVCALAMASDEAKSTAGSTTFTPPATLTKTSSAARRISALFFQDRDDHSDAIAADAADLAFGGTDDAGCRQRLHFDQQHATALHGGRQDRAAGRSARADCSTKRLPGSVTSFRPFPVISNRPTSCVEPKRFFTHRTMRWAGKRSPSESTTTVSTMRSIISAPRGCRPW